MPSLAKIRLSSPYHQCTVLYHRVAAHRRADIRRTDDFDISYRAYGESIRRGPSWMYTNGRSDSRVRFILCYFVLPFSLRRDIPPSVPFATSVFASATQRIALDRAESRYHSVRDIDWKCICIDADTLLYVPSSFSPRVPHYALTHVRLFREISSRALHRRRRGRDASHTPSIEPIRPSSDRERERRFHPR